MLFHNELNKMNNIGADEYKNVFIRLHLIYFEIHFWGENFKNLSLCMQYCFGLHYIMLLNM